MSTPEIRGNVITDVENISGKVLGVRGKQGFSAYELAVQEGYTGTEEEWLASLKGSPGDPGQDGEDGHSPVITATKSGNVTTVKVDGTAVATINDGEDGHSPVISATKSGKVTTITADGVTIATINDGNDGQDGQDGHSPVITTSKSGKTTTILADGTSIGTVLDGNDGQDGVTPSFSIGTVQSGQSADASITGTDANPVLNLTLPKGDDGQAGQGIPTGGTQGQVLKKSSATDYDTEWADESGTVTDVQIDGSSVVSDGVASVPLADASNFGLVKVDYTQGVGLNSGFLAISGAPDNDIKTGGSTRRPIQPSSQHKSVFYGLAKASGDTTQSQSSNAVGVYTEEAKSKIHDMLNAPVTVSGTTPTINAMSGVRYVCGEVATLSITPPQTGCIDVVFTSGGTPTALTVPSTVEWLNGFDPDNLDANTVYEINILDGVMGVAGSWA